jgi:glycosyltransferase involved in cell wall biosynthesis
VKVLFVQPTLNPPGGGELLAAWLVQALVQEHEVTLLAWERPRLEECDRHFGTSLAGSDFKVELLPKVLGRTLNRIPLRLKRLKDAFLTRACLELAPRFDLVVTANNEMDLGGHGLQYLHYPQARLYAEGMEPPDLLLRLYFTICDRIAGDSVERVRSNVTLVNSDWTGRWTRRIHPIETRTVYPPVPGVFADLPWEEKTDAVLALGRLVPEKRFEEIVGAVAAVRAAGHPLRLTIAAFAGDDPAYADRIRAMVRAHADWATLRKGLSRADLEAALAGHRYGMHAMVDEHFGISVAEMVRAGCIVFVPNSGGPAEIVGEKPRLKFANAGEAAMRLAEAVADAGLREELRRHLAARSSLFSAERFVREILEVVKEAGARRRVARAPDATGPAAQNARGAGSGLNQEGQVRT